MSEKMHASRVMRNLDRFRIGSGQATQTRLMRSHLDMFLLWQTVSYFQPRSFLEIGFAAGQTMGIMYESSGGSKQYVSVDISYHHRDIFTDVFPEAKIDFLEIDSRHLQLSAHQRFDFIHIDGDHSYEMVINDIDRCWSGLDPTGILYIDDYALPGVDHAIRQRLLVDDWVPFLSGDQSLFFHHGSQCKDKWLDHDLQEVSKNFVTYGNQDLYDHVVLKATMPNVFVDFPDIFLQALKAYDL